MAGAARTATATGQWTSYAARSYRLPLPGSFVLTAFTMDFADTAVVVAQLDLVIGI